MPLFNWPYTNLHNLNLDWIIKKIKNVETAETNTAASEEAAAGSAASAAESEANAAESETNAAASATAAGNYYNQIRENVSTLVTGWMDEHITPTTPPVDDTLTIQGAAADAKKTGDEITDLKNALHMLPYVNLFDKTDITAGVYINSTGGETASSGWNISNYIPINEYSPLYFNIDITAMPLAVRIGFYDTNRNYLDNFTYSQETVLNAGYIEQIPENAVYVRFSLRDADIDTFICRTKELITKSDNTINAEQLTGVSANTYLEDESTTGYWNTSTQEVIVNSAYKATPLIRVKKGDICRFIHAGSRTFVLYSDAGTVIDYRNYSNTVTKYEGYYEVISDGFIGFSYVATYTDYKVYLNGNRVIKNASIEWLNIPQNASWSTWTGKTAIMFGDSLVSGQRDDSSQGGAYCRRLKEHLLLSDCINEGRSGHPVADGTPNGAGTVSTVMSITNYTDYDLVIIAGGTNDFKLNVPIGTIANVGSTFDRNTFYGALQAIFEYLMSKKANIRTCLWTPLQRDNDGYDIYYTNSAGHKLIDYCNAIKEVGALYSVPVVDMYKISGVNMLNLSYYTADGLHLNGNGYDIVSFIGAKQINIL